MLRLYSFKVSPALFLSECLPQDGLVALIAFLLSINIIQGFALILLAEERLVLILLFEALLLYLLQLALCTLLQLVCHRHGQVLLPELELSLQLRVVGELGEE